LNPPWLPRSEVMDDARLRPAPGHAHPERVEHELRAQVVSHRPANAATAPGVDDRREEQVALPGRHVGDVGDPEPVRSGRPKPAADEVLRRRDLLGRPRRLRPLAPPRDALDSKPTHQARDALAGDPEAVLVGELGVDARDAGGLPQALEDAPHELRELAVSELAPAGPPRIEAGAGHAEHAAQQGGRGAVLSPPRSTGTSSRSIGLPGEESRCLAQDLALLLEPGVRAAACAAPRAHRSSGLACGRRRSRPA